MSAGGLYGGRLVAVVAGGALVLGGATTGLVAATGAFDSRSTGCGSPALAGQVVDVTAMDMGGAGMMGGRGPYGMGMMRLLAGPGTVSAGTVSLRVVNVGSRTHEVVVLPLAAGQGAGQRAVGSDGKVDESGSLGEASNNCGAGAGDGITAGATGWVTLTLPPGRYELLCNQPWHYGAGMYTELDVTAP